MYLLVLLLSYNAWACEENRIRYIRFQPDYIDYQILDENIKIDLKGVAKTRKSMPIPGFIPNGFEMVIRNHDWEPMYHFFLPISDEKIKVKKVNSYWQVELHTDIKKKYEIEPGYLFIFDLALIEDCGSQIYH